MNPFKCPSLFVLYYNAGHYLSHNILQYKCVRLFSRTWVYIWVFKCSFVSTRRINHCRFVTYKIQLIQPTKRYLKDTGHVVCLLASSRREECTACIFWIRFLMRHYWFYHTKTNHHRVKTALSVSDYMAIVRDMCSFRW